MTPNDVLIELLERLGAARDGNVYVAEVELREWPAKAVDALKRQKILARARPAKSVVCPGCEHACAMPVHMRTRTDGTSASFVACDKRDDISRVPISVNSLKQWRCDSEGLKEFIATCLDIRVSHEQQATESIKIIGTMRGNERRQTLSLKLNGQVSIVAGNRTQLLADLTDFEDGKFTVDADAIRDLVDSATSADATYAPSIDRREERKGETQAMHREWQDAYHELKKTRPNQPDRWYSRQIARMDISRRRSAETIRKQMKK